MQKNKTKKQTVTKPQVIDVRYKPTRETIKIKLATHFSEWKLDLEERGGKADVTKLIAFMGITSQRWKALIQKNQPPLLCEVASYAAYMLIDINDLYENIPINSKKSA